MANFFYSTFLNVFFILATFLRFLTFFLFFLERFYVYAVSKNAKSLLHL